MDPVRTTTLRQMKAEGRKIPVLTAYDAAFASLLSAAGVPVLLVGDSLGMVVQGRDSTLPVTLADMAYHSAAVARAADGAMVIADLPFGSYSDPGQGLDSAVVLMQAGAHMVKLEGGNPRVLAVIEAMSDYGIPVCAHLGLLPQSVHKAGGYRVQGREQGQADQIRAAAQAVQQAGAEMLVLECVPAALAADISAAVDIPVIGIGAGPACDGQVLVVYDMLGLTPGPLPRFCKNFMAGQDSLQAAVSAYVAAVSDGSYPAAEHGYD